MRSPTTAGKIGTFSALTFAGAAVVLFHTAAFAQQPEPKKDDAVTEGAKEAKPKKASVAKAKKGTDAEAKTTLVPEVKAAPAPAPETKTAPAPEAKTAPTPEAQAKESPAPDQAQELPPEYSPPPGYRRPPPPPPRYPQPPSEEPYYGPYYHDNYYGPPPHYPPPRYYRRYAPPPPPSPVRYYPEPLRYRTFFFGFGLGVSGLGVFQNAEGAGNASRVGLGYAFRFGFGVSPRWSLVLAADGASAYFDDISISETVFTVGPQFFITRNLYARAGIGAAGRTYDYGDYYDRAGYYYTDSESDSGMGAVGAIGFEFMQSYHVAMALEASGTVGFYPNRDVLSTFGVNFVLNLF